MTIIHQEVLEERARNLDAKGLNGMELVLVTLPSPTEALLEVHFFNNRELANIVNVRDFLISGGHRVLAGPATGQVQVSAIAHPSPTSNILLLTVTPIGDYSTYTLSLNFPNIDLLFNELRFKFRPGCFSTECAPKQTFKPAPQDPAIDYLAKDYDSFRHTMIAAMMQRVPGWRPTSEADLDQVLLELFSVAADELSDYQDRVMNEAYLPTARKRVSLARHARLMDYHIHQGNQASTWVAVQVADGEIFVMPKGFLVWTGEDVNYPSAAVFMTQQETPPLFSVDTAFETDLNSGTISSNLRDRFTQNKIDISPNLASIQVLVKLENQIWLITDTDTKKLFLIQRGREALNIYAPDMHHLLNEIELYSWSGAIPSLAAGSTSADLKLAVAGEEAAKFIQNLIHCRQETYLLIQEWLNPETGTAAGINPAKRQLLKLLPGAAGATALRDPYTGEWLIRVRWEEKDKLQFNYCFTVDCQDGQQQKVSLFHGNLIQVYHGRPRTIEFKEAGTFITANQYYYQRTKRWGTLCQLPPEPLAYKATPVGGEVPPQSTLEVEVIVDGVIDPWDEAINLIHSDDSAEAGDRFMVETDELGQSIIRFGNGINGRKLPDGATVRCNYQVGLGLEGHVGADTLIYFDPAFKEAIESVWNPFDVSNGKAPEPVAEIIRRVPEAYRFLQLRAVTLQDYIKRAEELPEVSKAAARYAWTGSWRTVQIAIDPVGITVLDEPFWMKLRQKLARHLDAVRLIGEDLEIRPPRFVPLEIHVVLCIHPEYWREDIKFILEQEFSDGFTADGRMAFFHPDRWTFGQELHASQIIGRVQAIEGVEHVISVTLKRWNEATPGTDKIANLRSNEIIQVRNDPDHMEKGLIYFDVRGGRQ